MELLSDDDDNSEKLSLNKKFAEKFEREARLKELRRGAELGLFDEDGEDEESSDEEEDDDGAALSYELDKQIIRTINAIRKRDPKIYDKTTTWFDDNDDDEDDEEATEVPRKSSKKKYKDIVREQALEDIAEEDEASAKSRKTKKAQLSYDSEQSDLRESILRSIAGVDVDDNDSEDMLKPIAKSSREQAEEEAALQRELDEMKRLGSCGLADPQADEFLFNYMSQQKWKDKSNVSLIDVDEEGGDEEELDEIDRFESSYNFRFEELSAGDVAAAGQVVGHARTVDDSVRRKDMKRKEQREARAEKKEKERRQKEAELRRLKNLKRLELEERMKKISETGGLADLGIDSTVLDEDWDPSAHEEMMRQQFGDEYYAQEEEGFMAEDGEGEDYGEEYYGEEYYGEEGEGEEYAEEGHGGVPVKRGHAAGLEELYQLDYEDIVAGIPCRFKYKQIDPEDYGLAAEDILFADDKELNQFVGLKRLATYRTDRLDPAKLSKKRKRLRAVVKERIEEAQQVGGTKSDTSKKFGEVGNKEEIYEKTAAEAGEDDPVQATGKRKRKRKLRV